MIVEKMTEQDLNAVVAIEQDCFSLPWTRENFASALASKDALFLVAKEEDSLLGYAGMFISFDEGEITNVAVDALHRKKGTGRRLMQEIQRIGQECGVRRIVLEVRKSNMAAITLYEKMNFLVVGTRRDFYDFPKEDALIMVWEMDTE